jgi:hypothetical protein
LNHARAGCLIALSGYLFDNALSLWLCGLHNETNGEGLAMKKLFLVGALLLAAPGAHAQYYGTGSNPNSHTVQGHATTSGTYVQPYVATNPNSTQRDNYSATGNVNPYTGTLLVST